MKRLCALVLAALMLSLVLVFPVNAGDPIEVFHSATWIIIPERIGPGVSYVSKYYKTGEQVVVPDIEEPKYETDEYFYNFVGWKLMTSVDEIRNYYNNKPGIGMRDSFKQEPLPIMGNDELNFAAVFRLIPKQYDVNRDRAVNIGDVTELLNYLSKTFSYNEIYDVLDDGDINIKDVAVLLNFLSE